MVNRIRAGPYVSRSTINDQLTTVVYQGPSYDGPDARECARHGINVAGIQGEPIRRVAFAWGNDNVDVAAIQPSSKFPGNPYADLFSIRDGKLVPTANFCGKELGRLGLELDLVARLITGKSNPDHGQQFEGKPVVVRNSYDVPLVVRRIDTFPERTDLAGYVRKSAGRLGINGDTEVGLVFAYGTTAGSKTGKIRPAVDFVAIPRTQQTPRNPDFDMHTVVGNKEWQPAGICRLEVPVVVESAKRLARLGIERFVDAVETA